MDAVMTWASAPGRADQVKEAAAWVVALGKEAAAHGLEVAFWAKEAVDARGLDVVAREVKGSLQQVAGVASRVARATGLTAAVTQLASQKSVQVTAGSAAAGAVVLGAGGAAAGAATGGALGIAAGLPLAPLTLGLSPVMGAAMGSGPGLALGGAAGSAAGALGGGAAGYAVYQGQDGAQGLDGPARQALNNLSSAAQGTWMLLKATAGR